LRFLLDVNVLIALLDVDHVGHDRATEWFEQTGHKAWATCPIIENGIIRILGGAAYTAVPFNCTEVAQTLREWCDSANHSFWPDEFSLLLEPAIELDRLTSPGRITDTYLLALAVRNGGKLATMDRRLSPDGVKDGKGALELIT
jgi:toxin-antitoxin system PIN domain toxin